MKKFFVVFCLFAFFVMPAYTQNTKLKGILLNDITIDNSSKEIAFKLLEPAYIYDNTIIPAGAIISVTLKEVEKEKRFHKSGYFKCKINSYKIDEVSESVRVPDFGIYFVGRKYVELDKTEAALTGAEFASTTLAGFMLPGVDLAYYFTKGAIRNDKGDNRFKSGISTAYDNSIFWVFEKGRPIDLKTGDKIIVIRQDFDTNKQPE